MIHPARVMPYRELADGLQAANDNGLVNIQTEGDLRLYTYSRECVYTRAWTSITELARGLILDAANDNVIATPFPKFFNLGERATPLPANTSFESFEKLDGSLIIIWHYQDRWRASTKGSFQSAQAQWAQNYLDSFVGELLPLEPGTTYLAEYVGPGNRIVVHYPNSKLVLLGAYNERGAELAIDNLWPTPLSDVAIWGTAKRQAYSSIADLIATAGTLPATAEGFVVRFGNGLRVKIKGDEYCRLHRLVSRVTPLAIWESMVAGDDMDAMRRELPEEFWIDFDCIRAALIASFGTLMQATQDRVDTYADWSDKDLGLKLPHIHPDIRGLVFPLRKHGAEGVRKTILKSIRPTGNRLAGYVPSGGMQRVQEAA
jgi:RNA ligase